MSVKIAKPPVGGLYRVTGTRYDPSKHPPKGVLGQHRFDDIRSGRGIFRDFSYAPIPDFSILYAAPRRRTAFIETLGSLRPDAVAVETIKKNTSSWISDMPIWGTVNVSWCSDRHVGRFYLEPGQRWLDIRSNKTLEVLRAAMSNVMLLLGYDDFNVAAAIGRNRVLTQIIALWAFEHGYHGIAYGSYYDPRLQCWGIFDTAKIKPEKPTPINPTDSDFIGVAKFLHLKIR